MPAISVDLASGDYSDIGVAVLTRDEGGVLIAPIDLGVGGLHGRPHPQVLARFLVELAAGRGATAIGLDGPQSWKSATNGLQHSRVCEAKLHTQGKTGLPGTTKPGNYLGFISFCIQTFDALEALGWPRLGDRAGTMATVSVETFPTAAWRALGLPSLPGKRRSRDIEITAWADRLVGLGGIHLSTPMTHDQLQAAVAGLGVLALTEASIAGFEAVGDPPVHDGAHWLEGFIVNPRRVAVV